VQLGGRLISIVAGVTASVLLGRHLGPAVYGQYVYVIAYLGIFAMVASFSLETLAVRELAAHPQDADDILSTVLTLRLALSAAVIPIALAFLLATEASPELRFLVALTCPILLTGAVSSVGTLFGARMAAQYRVASELVQPVVFLTAAVLITLTGAGITAVIVAHVVSFALYSGVLFAVCRRFARPRLRLDAGYARRMVRAALPVGVGGIFFQIYYRVDILILDRWQGSEAVGLYGVAYGFFGQAPALFSLIATTIFPVLVVHAARGAPALAGTVWKSVALAVGLGVPATLVTSLVAPTVLRLVYGSAFEGAGTALAILGLALPFSFCTYVINYGLVAIDRHHTTWQINGLAALLNIGLNWLMVPTLGYVGTAYATVATEAFVCLIQAAILRWHLARVDGRPRVA
jgi:O-antigen/teichoic acid export membrane protein